ncbi:hypothetical protein AOX63_00390 [Pseudomonas sp. ADP]|nr:hypothetical protein AOX63_00390 [Pseudomonas sp. ADP]OBP12077.1 hypothetical protein BAE52_05945 [Pseudomonas sp. EGD-AKN5]
MEKCFGGEPDSSRSASSWEITNVFLKQRSHNISIRIQSLIQSQDLIRSCTFLWAENVRSSLWPDQWIVDITGNINPNFMQLFIQPVQIDLPKSFERQATLLNLIAGRVEELGTKRSQHSGTAIIGRTPSEPYDDSLRAGAQSLQEQLAGPEGGSARSVALPGWNQVDATSCRHFDHRGAGLV